ncbi:hypothetical protein PHMEG_00020540 [Phytophthora megakarya]|uniref:Uncharacterized protein n=1 Tax=Phytophthora megakarya TaxID=4795 RepID=A0A225VNJ2_9STRA|nr:hypothetical protein PHMEG_00020540 [Phytophthora megakarya]
MDFTLTEDGVITPTRVLMDGTNSVAYVQSTVQTRSAKKRETPNPKKCKVFLTEAPWSGRVVSAHGVRHDPARIEALRQRSSPSTGQELQQFNCALNWM